MTIVYSVYKMSYERGINKAQRSVLDKHVIILYNSNNKEE